MRSRQGAGGGVTSRNLDARGVRRRKLRRRAAGGRFKPDPARLKPHAKILEGGRNADAESFQHGFLGGPDPVEGVAPPLAFQPCEKTMLGLAEEIFGEREFVDIFGAALDIDADRAARGEADQSQRARMRRVEMQIVMANERGLSEPPRREDERLRWPARRLGEKLAQRRARQHEARAIFRPPEPVRARNLVLRKRKPRLIQTRGASADIDKPEARVRVRRGQLPPAETIACELRPQIVFPPPISVYSSF